METQEEEFYYAYAEGLRAGMIFCEIAQELLPFANVHHIGMYRDEETLEPVWYYDKRKEIKEDKNKVFVLILDPMLATGGSAIDAVKTLKKYGVKNISFICIIAAPEGAKAFAEAYPDIPLYIGALDRELNENAYICPGLGDCGDRIYGTVDE